MVTKYYSAPVEWVVLPAAEYAAPSEGCAGAALSGAEALVLVTDATRPEEFSVPDAWLALVNTAQPACLLVCTNKCDLAAGVAPGEEGEEGEGGDEAAARAGGAGGGGLVTTYGSIGDAAASASAAAAAASRPRREPPPQAHREHVGRVLEWALDHGFEHVEVAATRPLVGAAARDKTGVPRVLEALQANMWSNMERAAAAAAAPPAAAEASSTSTSGGSGGGIFANLNLQPAQASSSGEAAPDAGEGDEEGGDGGGSGGADIGALMEEMRRVRERALQPGVTDEERRAAATAMTMRLMALLGADAGDEEEGEGEGEGSGSD